MEEVEDADPGSSARVGWLNRLIGTDADTSPLQGFSLGERHRPASLYGPQPVMSAGNVDDVGLAGDDDGEPAGALRSLHTLWDGDSRTLGRAMRATFDAVGDLRAGQGSSRRRRRTPRRTPAATSARRWPKSPASSAATSASR